MRASPLLTICGLALSLGVGSAILPARAAEEPLGIALEGFPYPNPVFYLPLTRDGEAQRLAYMDVPAAGSPNGRTALLLHGRNFPSSYWQSVIEALTAAGYRVVAPDQLGFGKSSKRELADHSARRTTLIGRAPAVQFWRPSSTPDSSSRWLSATRRYKSLRVPCRAGTPHSCT